MPTNYTDPTPAQRAALGNNAAFSDLIYVGICSYAYAHYVEAASNPDSAQNNMLSQVVTNAVAYSNKTWAQLAAIAIAHSQDTPVEWFSLTDDFSSVDATTLDSLIDSCFKPITGYVNYAE